MCSDRRRSTTLFAAIVLVGAAVGCSGDDAGGSASVGAAIDGDVVTRALGQLPIGLFGDRQVELRFGDLDEASRLAGIDRPARDDYEASVLALAPITGGPPASGTTSLAPSFVPLPDGLTASWRDVEAADDELGFSIADVTWFVEYSVPPGVVTVFGGDFPVDRLTAAMGEPDDGTWSLGGEEGTTDLAAATAARPIGEALRITSTGEQLVVARTAEALDATRGLVTGESDGASAADHPLVGPLASSLDAAGVHGATVLVGGDFSVRADLEPLLDGPAGALVLPERFDALAVGNAVDDDGPLALVAYAHETTVAAERNAAAIDDILRNGSSLDGGTPWSTLFAQIDVTVDADPTSDVSVVTVTVRFADDVHPAQLHRAVMRGDGIATHR